MCVRMCVGLCVSREGSKDSDGGEENEKCLMVC